MFELLQVLTNPVKDKPLEWWQVAGGIIAIPVSLIGIFYTFYLIKKTKLESTKIELEILEKRKAINQIVSTNSETQNETSIPSIKKSKFDFIVLKFIFLWLIANSWGLLAEAIRYSALGIYYLYGKATGQSIDDLDWIGYILLGLTKIPEVLYWLAFFMVGLSLLKDINSYLNIDLREFFRFKKK